jgi:hypothetical protein
MKNCINAVGLLEKDIFRGPGQKAENSYRIFNLMILKE